MASRRARARRKPKKHLILRFVLITFVALILLAVAGTAMASAVVSTWLQDLPDATQTKVAQATKIYSADGKLLARLFLENREVVPLPQISPYLQHGVVATEDERFYQHQGYDLYGIARAVVKDFTSKSRPEGASTLTQQYVRQTVLQKEATQVSLSRKIREIYLAQQIEQRFTKDQILAMYLNTVYYGDGAYGAEAAAKHYFNKSAKDLTLGEAAMLAGLPQSPRRLNPLVKENEKRAIERQHWVLAKMLDNHYITVQQYKDALNEKLQFESAPLKDGVYAAPFFVSYVKKQLQDMYGTSVVFKGGLKVYTTLDTSMQSAAEKSRDDFLNEPGDPEASLVSIDPSTGYIKAMVGGRDFSKNQFNLAVQGKRQPGSSFKMFTLVTALEHGIPPYRAFDSDSPAVIPGTGGAPDWVVQNSEGKGEGMVSLEEATAKSINCVFARLIEELGPAEVALTAKRMGITTPIPAIPSITLGTKNCSPLEMASAYGTLAANGVHAKAQGITKVVGPDGKMMYDGRPQRTQAVSPQIAYAATKVLEGVIDHGTAAHTADIGRPAAGKTGTSENYRDAWFVGYTPQLVTAVWVGYKTERPMEDVHGQRGFGGTLAAPIWNSFMTAVLDGKPELDFKSFDDPSYDWKDDWSRGGGNDNGNGNNGDTTNNNNLKPKVPTKKGKTGNGKKTPAAPQPTPAPTPEPKPTPPPSNNTTP